MGVRCRSRRAFYGPNRLSIRDSSFEQVVVMVDGLRMSNPPSGHFDLDHTAPLEHVERGAAQPGLFALRPRRDGRRGEGRDREFNQDRGSMVRSQRYARFARAIRQRSSARRPPLRAADRRLPGESPCVVAPCAGRGAPRTAPTDAERSAEVDAACRHREPRMPCVQCVPCALPDRGVPGIGTSGTRAVNIALYHGPNGRT